MTPGLKIIMLGVNYCKDAEDSCQAKRCPVK